MIQPAHDPRAAPNSAAQLPRGDLQQLHRIFPALQICEAAAEGAEVVQQVSFKALVAHVLEARTVRAR